MPGLYTMPGWDRRQFCDWRLERFFVGDGLGARGKVDGQTQAEQGNMVCYSRR